MITATGANRKPVKQVKPSKLQNKKKCRQSTGFQMPQLRNFAGKKFRISARQKPLPCFSYKSQWEERLDRETDPQRAFQRERERERVLQSEFLERGVFHRFFREKNNGEIHYPRWHFHYSLKPISGFFHRTPRNHRSSHRSHANRKQI